MGDPVRRARVGVVPAAALTRRPRLFAALAAAFPVSFEGRPAGDLRGLDAVIAVGRDVEAGGLPALVADGEERARGAGTEVRLAGADLLARPLRGVTLRDAGAAPLRAMPPAGDVVLAQTGGAPAWTARTRSGARRDAVAAFPPELAPGELLRRRLVPGRALALLAVAHFLRDLTAAFDWRPPPPRAAIVLDDPNLHWPSYGHVRYREVLAHAARHDYHLAVAMVPLDAWLVHPGAARLFRAGADRLSVLVHGNDHDGPELGRVASEADAVRLAAQALRRVERFERRSGVRVARVMAPPHERVTAAALRGLAACGYEAICTTRPFPWLPESDRSWLAAPADASPLAGWRAAETVAGGLPLVLRVGLDHPREELALRAFLGQPVVLYGHHDDLAGGLDVLADTAAAVNRLGDVRWGSLSAIARGAVQTRRDGDVLHVRMLARRVEVDVPAGVSSVLVYGQAGETARRLPVQAPARLVLPIGGQAAPALPAAAARPRLWPLARRIASEGRDRLRAAV